MFAKFNYMFSKRPPRRALGVGMCGRWGREGRLAACPGCGGTQAGGSLGLEWEDTGEGLQRRRAKG